MKIAKSSLSLVVLLVALAGCVITQAAPDPEPPTALEQQAPRVAQVPPQVQQKAAPPAQEEALVVADQLYWVGPEGNLALDITAKFNSSAALLKHLDLKAPVGSFQGKDWTLRQIVVAMDFNANGEVASWLISGPKPLVEGYFKALQASGDTYDLGRHEVNVAPTAMMEAGEE